jgi:hypothetical protein
VPLDGYFREGRLPLKHVYVFRRRANLTGFSLKPLAGPQKVRVLLNHTYREHFLQGLELARDHFQRVSRVALSVRVTGIVRPGAEGPIEQLVDAVEHDLRAAGASEPISKF